MKNTLLLLATFLCLTITNAQAVGDTFTEGDYNYKVTSISPLEVEVTGSPTVPINISIPATATDLGTGTTYNVKTIGYRAFYVAGGYATQSIVLAEGITEIGQSSFNNLLQLTSVSLPNTLTYIGYRAFRNCPSLTSITIPNSVTSTGGQAFQQTGIVNLVYPNSVTSVGGSDCTMCGSLVSVTLPNTLTTIENRTFKDCPLLTAITIPATVTFIDVKAFGGTTGALKDVEVLSAIPANVVADAFENKDLSTINLYVPIGSKTAYETAAVWSAFNIIEGTLSVKSQELLNISVYPNPSSGKIFVQTKQQKDLDLTVFDLNGRTLLSAKGTQIDISYFSKGVYILKGETEEGDFVKRIIKQ